MKILTAEQMRRIDERTEREFHVSADTLMDNAGRAVAETLMRLYPGLGSRPPMILCGKGNNGGDGIAAARHLLASGVSARVALLAPRDAVKGPAALHLARAEEAGVLVEEAAGDQAWQAVAASMREAGVLVDAILGTGLAGPARGPAARAIAAINAAGVPVVSVDVPSGLSADTGALIGPAVRADHTVALACPKMAHVFDPAAGLSGQLHVVDIGIPFEAVQAEQVALNLLTEQEVAAILPPRESDSHKGDYGRLLVVAGSRGKSGAAALVCRAALRSGAGLVTAATSRSAQPILAGHLAEMMTEALEETEQGAIARAAAPALAALERACDVMVIGPGLTAGQETASLVRDLVATAQVPVVLDADGLNAYAGRSGELEAQVPLVVTPHPGEMARLLSPPGGQPVGAAQVQEDRIGVARTLATRRSCYVILKGHRTVIADPEGDVWINTTGNPGMASGGTGDALTGIVAALLAQGISPLESCALAVYVHGLAGDLAAADIGETSLMAGDLIDYLPEAFLHLERSGE
jgi:NAD(P)H-hydrate epimerase